MNVTPMRTRAGAIARAAMLLPLLAVAAAADQPAGVGDLLVAPTRVVLEGTTRSAAVTLRNTGTRAALYRLSFEHYRMTDDGRAVPVEAPEAGAAFADELVRFSPRQVLLEPGASQTVRLLLRKPADLAAGEYRSHLTFRAVPDTLDPVESARVPGAWSVRLEPIYGVSIPVIVRHGDTAASMAITQARLVEGPAGTPGAIHVTLEREGTRSAYGDIEIARAKGPRKADPLGRARGVGIWLPSRSRSVVVPLDPNARASDLQDLVVTYVSRDSGEAVSAPVSR